MLGTRAVLQRPATLFKDVSASQPCDSQAGKHFICHYFPLGHFFGNFPLLTKLPFWLTATATGPSSLTLLCCHPMPWACALPSASVWTQYSVVTPRCRFLNPFTGCCLMAAVFFVLGSWDNGRVLQRQKENKEAAHLQPRRRVCETTLRNEPQRRDSRLWRYKSNIPDNGKCLYSPVPQMRCGSLPFTELRFSSLVLWPNHRKVTGPHGSEKSISIHWAVLYCYLRMAKMHITS